MSYLSPLRYPGSKRKLANFIVGVLDRNKFKPKLYYEPFFGGGSVGLELLKNGSVEKVIFSDSDPWVADFWWTVFFDTNWLIEQISSIEVTIEKWHELKEKTPVSKRENALHCLFFNRTNFSGIMRSEVGPLGGKKQESKYKIDCRFPKDTLINRIEFISNYSKKVIDVWDTSWKEGFNRLFDISSKRGYTSSEIFVYLDPPFFEKADKLYRHYFQMEDHVELKDFLEGANEKWLLSYDNSDGFYDIYGDLIKESKNGTKKQSFELTYSAGLNKGREPTREVILSNLDFLSI